MYFDEDLILDLRLNILDKFVDYFVIVESIFTHRGEKRNLKFNINKFKKFESKIIYLVYDQEPSQIEKIVSKDTEDEKSRKYIMNALFRENAQRNFINRALNNLDNEDVILVSDVDEIPNLKGINFEEKKSKIILFKQDMLYYKFNLKLPNLAWTGTKACKKKYFKSAQWLRNVKDRKYPFYRVDTYFSEKKYINCEFIENGGWHFTNIMSPEDLEKKLLGFLHHVDYESSGLKLEDLKRLMNEKRVMYNNSADKKNQKWGVGKKLQKKDLSEMPNYVLNNINKYKLWLDI